MKTGIKTAALALLSLTIGISMQAQQAITIVGGSLGNNTGSISFSGGEVAAQCAIAPAITVVNITEQFNEGVQQPYTDRDKNLTGIAGALEVAVTVYPNPAADEVTIESGDSSVPLYYTLYNTNGQTLTQGNMAGQQRIDLTGFTSGAYLLRLSDKASGRTNTYRITVIR